MKKRYIVLFFTISFSFFQSCKKDLDKIEKPQWNPQLSFPWIKTSMSLADILPEDSNLVATGDNLLKIVYRDDSLYSFRAADFLHIPEQQTNEEVIRIDRFAMPELNSGDSITLWEFVDYFNQQAQDSLIANNGGMALFPEGNLIAPYSSGFSLFENFQEASLESGKLEFRVTNGLPVTVTDVQIALKDAESGTSIGNFTFNQISPGETVFDELNIGEMHIGNQIQFSLLSMFTPGSGEPVFVDLGDGIYFQLTARELVMNSGSGMLVEQDIETQSREIDFVLDDSSAWLENVFFEEALLQYEFESRVPVDMLLQVKLPGGEIHNEMPVVSVMIPAGASISKEWNLNNLHLEINQTEQGGNSIAVEYDLHLFATEEVITIDTSAYVSGLLKFESIKVEGANGYFGKRIFEVAEVEMPFTTSILKNFVQGVILDDPKINLNYVSSAGVPFAFKAAMEGISSDGSSKILEADSLYVNAAGGPGESIEGNFRIDKNNSSIIDFLSSIPESYRISGTAITNNTGVQKNFIHRESSVQLGVEMDLPLVLQSGSFVFSDTMNIRYTSDQLDKMETAIFYIDAVNGFPFNLNMQIIPLEKETFIPADTLELGQLFAAVTGEGGKVTQPHHSVLKIELDKQMLFHLKQANRMIIRAAMNMEGNPGVAALFTDYSVDVKIGLQANVNY